MSNPNLDDVDFDAVYRGNSIAEGTQVIPWDVGGPQPRVVELAEAGEIGGKVLDAGCGLGDNALFLASRGFDVTGVDGAPTAIAKAAEKAKERGLDAEFVVADATKLEGFENRFDTVLDSALYHVFDDNQKRAYVRALGRACRPGATLHLFCADAATSGLPIPHPDDEQSLRAAFSQGWRVTRLKRTEYSTAFTMDTIEQIRESWPEAAEAMRKVGADEQGRIQLPVWHLTAVREP